MKPDAPVLLVRWYNYTKWLLERVDNFPKNQRFIFGTRLADMVLKIMELLVEASYTRRKGSLLRQANVKLEQVRWQLDCPRRTCAKPGAAPGYFSGHQTFGVPGQH